MHSTIAIGTFTIWSTVFFTGTICAQRITQTFMNPAIESGTFFNHLVVDHNTGRVYVGAVNKIYQLSPSLKLLQSAVTGPVNNSDLCTFECSDDNTKLTDNVNKALLIDYDNNRLVACGSVLEGLCSVRSLTNISQDVREIQEMMVANDEISSSVAFIAPGPPNPPKTQVMYIGVTFTDNSPYRSEIPAVSSRSLEDDNLFAMAHDAVTSGTKMYINALARSRYIINYVYGFSSEGFSYFLTTQRKHIVSNEYYSKLVRVCDRDEYYNSYTEIPISCATKGEENIDYNLVQAGFVGRAGSILAQKLGITTQDDILFAVFSRSNSNFSTRSDLSALCVYSLKAIRRTFTQNIKACYSGNGSTGLDFISPPRACTHTGITLIKEDFCGLDINTPLGGEQPVKAVPVIVYTKTLTAVAVTSTGDYTVGFVGTAQGHLKKIVIENGTFAFEYGHMVIHEGFPVNKDLYFDSRFMYLYVMTQHQVARVKIQKCNIYKRCAACLQAKDPYCGWCTIENKCTTASECHFDKDFFFWVPYHIGRCTTFTDRIFKPIIMVLSVIKLVSSPIECFADIITYTARILASEIPKSIVQTFVDKSAPTNSYFNHLVVHRKTGRLYIGAVNRIYELGPNLDVAQWIVTGPINDSTLCSFDCSSKYYVKKQTDNVNKVLVIDYANNRLITCGSVLQGMCSVLDLNNIYIRRDVGLAIVANDASASTVAFIAPGPSSPYAAEVLYVGVTFTGNSPYRHEVPAVSSRALDNNRLFEIAKIFCKFCYNDQVVGTRIFVNTLYRQRHIINYVYGFSSGKFSYFLTNQRKTNGVFYTNLVRICHDDEQYSSYTEIPLSCKGKGIDFNILQAAFVGKSGNGLAGYLGISKDGDVLYALFSPGSTNSSLPLNSSALCVYSLQRINHIFTKNIESCFKGEGMRGLEHFLPNRHCVYFELGVSIDDYCGSNINSPLGGHQPMESFPVAVFIKRLTAVVATVTGDNTVVFAGTAQGRLKKILVQNTTYAFEYGDIPIDLNSPVNSLSFDNDLMHLYVMTERKITKVKVQTCSFDKTCYMCLEAKDPYCGWCSRENKCSLRLDCMDKDNTLWIPFHDVSCVIITKATTTTEVGSVSYHNQTTSR